MVTYYEKRGKRYYPVLEKDLWSGGDTWPVGCHLVVCKPGVKTTRYNVEPNDSAFHAALLIHGEEIARLLVKASEAKIDPDPVTPEQRNAWNALKDAFNGGPFQVRYESASYIARKFLESLRDYSNSLSEKEKEIWEDGYLRGGLESKNELLERDNSIRNIVSCQESEMKKWRDAGITYESVRGILNQYQNDEISFGKLVDELRGLASGALKKLTDSE